MADENTGKTFTQEEVNQIVTDRLKREREHVFTQDQVDQMISDRLKREANTLEAYKAQMAAEAATQAEAKAIQDRFTAQLDSRGTKLIHPRLTDLLIEDFTAAVKDPANAGKTDDAIFTELFKDQEYFVPRDWQLFKPSPALKRPSANVSPDQIAQAFGLTKG